MSERDSERDDVLVRNAADPEQVGRARRKTGDEERRIGDAYRAVLATPEGRIVFWHLLAKCRVFETISVQNSLIYTLSGRRDVGLELTADLVRASEDLFEQMSREARLYARREGRENAAAHTPRASIAT